MTAILISGHLRDSCFNFTHLLDIKKDCEAKRKTCSIFVCTWSTIEPKVTHKKSIT